MAWETFETAIDGKPAIITVDTQAGAELSQGDLPNLLRVELASHELHGEVDSARAEQLEQDLKEWFGALGGRLVACVRIQQRIIWFIYVGCGWLEAAHLVHRIGLRCSLVLGAEMQADACHSVYHALLPSAAERRRAANARQLRTLSLRGLRSDETYRVQHVISFANHTQALALARLARSKGFHVDALLPPSHKQGRYTLQLSRAIPLTLEALDGETALLERLARQFGGTYAGWQVPQEALAEPAA